ncbi:MAG: CDGSH iron-sulfur domain-containing protein [Pseudoxanthomonas sp.]|nr:CDGSH iron-sulfur domain-containing protein [Pseudoxanthomonas sp.]
MAIETATGSRVVIRFDGSRCIHSRNCVLSHPDVFVPNVEGEWIHPDAVSPEEVALIARSCPSGAIQYERIDGGGPEPRPVVNLVHVRENGPLAFSAPVRIDGGEVQLRLTLCRCGLSKNKPYCDNSHKAAGFTASGEPPERASETLASRDGDLHVSPQRDGPLHVRGNLEVVSGTGRTLDRIQETWLCRCGHSSHKPFCDGSHRKAGFRADGA